VLEEESDVSAAARARALKHRREPETTTGIEIRGSILTPIGFVKIDGEERRHPRGRETVIGTARS
jgi:hypothetical protein